MASIRQQFEIPAKMKTWSLALIGVGLVALVTGLVTKGFSADEHEQAHFWGTLMYNTIFWTLVCNAAMFFICVTTLAMGGWQISFRRVTEAISVMVPIFGSITFVVLMYVVFATNTISTTGSIQKRLRKTRYSMENQASSILNSL
jgi:hypothetical protein